ncbi:MAG: PEP/pyruvate-binding domain-containing protein, partial [Verrucomicrobiales bacterium]
VAAEMDWDCLRDYLLVMANPLRFLICVCLLCRLDVVCAQVNFTVLDTKVSLTQSGLLEAQMHHLESSFDLKNWTERAVSNDVYDRYHLPLEERANFYRVRSLDVDETSDWTNQLCVPDERIFSETTVGGLENLTFAKFTVILYDLDRVYFQNSDRYPFHFDFARARLPDFATVSFVEYVRKSLFLEGQELLLGTVILPPDPNVKEVAIQFTGNEPFPREAVVEWFRAVRARLSLPEGWRTFYLPTFEQSDVAFQNEAWFAEQGVVVTTAARWVTENACYSSGWALGRLKYVASADIDAAYGDGRLTYEDVLVTDQIPAEIPVVAGVLALEPATPNAHVAILARSFRIPFAYPSGLALQEQIRAMDGREVLLVVSPEDGECAITLQDVDGKLAPEERQEILDRKLPPQVSVQTMVRSGVYHLETEQLSPADIDRAGGKAANFGFLRRALPDNSPDPAIALTFDLWMDFMEQPFGDGTLIQSIVDDLRGQSFPPDVASLRPILAQIRDRIRKGTDFTPSGKEAILQALAGFEDPRRLRFRSSTNVEDSEVFSGAGLYDSFSGCLADDTDNDSEGPSGCDTSRDQERGVFRAIRKVYASFYNETAFIERLRHGVDELEVGMAILVHYSFPDELEEANGVATLDIRKPADAARMVEAQLVSQVGANSITNANNELIAEVLRANYQGKPAEAEIEVIGRSGLVEGDGFVLGRNEAYGELLEMLDSTASAYESYFPDEQVLELDLEWKQVVPGEFQIKQVRRIPRLALVPPPVIE